MRSLGLLLVVVILTAWSGEALAQQNAPFKAAAVEFNPVSHQREENFPNMAGAIRQAATNGARLVLFPEMATTGYLYGSRSEIAPFVDTIPGRTTEFFEQVARETGTYVVAGMPEVDAETGMYYNAAFLVGPEGLIGKYRKNNLFLLESQWAVQGNLGVPVFETPLGRIGIIICYDDYYYQSARLASLKGADVLAFIASSGRLLDPDPKSAGVHISISDVQQQALYNGLYVVAANRSNIEKNDALGVGVHYLGGASIWNPLGHNLAQAPVSTQKGSKQPDDGGPIIIYADIDPAHFDNPVKDLLDSRRPELYAPIALNMAPRPMMASKQSHHVNALLVQYTPDLQAIDANKKKIDSLLASNVSLVTNLLVFPDMSLTGPPASADAARATAASAGEIESYFSGLADKFDSYLVFSSVVQEGGRYYKQASLLDPQGQHVGRYRKTHLTGDEKAWLAAGDELPVFETEIGRIGMLLGDETLFPEPADVLSVNRADMIVVPAAWHGQYGMADGLDKGFLARAYPDNTNVVWYATAKNAQAYLMAANFIGADQDFRGSSGLYSLDPTNGFYPPVVASSDSEEVFAVNFRTIAPTTWWTSQQLIIDGRRPQLYLPLVLAADGACFQSWKESAGYFVDCIR